MKEYKLALTFEDIEAQRFTMRFKYIKPNVSIQKIKELVNAIIKNGEIFSPKPEKICGASILEIKTTELKKDDEEWEM